MDPGELLVILKRALERRRLVEENRELRSRPAKGRFDRLIGATAGMQRLFADIEKVAPSDATVLILGESGTGKELVAHSIHEGSRRRNQLFVAVNASALPESLAESELFGHEKGAFTGAVASKPGRFELAHRGTLFLDEIGTLSPAVQSKLLRALETHEVERVGGRRSTPVDFRLVSATNEDLEARVAAGTFREDLFYRINTIVIRIPPLRERADDIPLLCDHFLEKFGDAPQEAPSALSPPESSSASAPTPGEATSESSSTSSRCSFSSPTATRSAKKTCRESSARPPLAASQRRAPCSFSKAVEDFERKLLTEAIAESGGVKAEAARRLGLDSNQIKYLCRKYGI